MTQLPMESWQVKARPDLPEYELNEVDARPGSSAPTTDDHHLWRRSFGKGYRESWWVELEDGTLVPNRVGLSQESHEMVERGGHRIVASRFNGKKGTVLFFWLTPKALQKIGDRDLNVYEVAAQYGVPLNPQPGPQVAADGRTAVGTDAVRGDMQLDTEGGETPHDEVCEHKAGAVPEGSTCPTCERRVPRKRKKDSPNTKTTSYRVPLDDVETHKETLEAVSEHMGIGTTKPHWQFWTITAMAAVVLQLPKGQVKVK